MKKNYNLVPRIHVCNKQTDTSQNPIDRPLPVKATIEIKGFEIYIYISPMVRFPVGARPILCVYSFI